MSSRILAYTLIGGAVTLTVFAQGLQIGSCPVLPADNIWNTRVDNLPAHPLSSTYVNIIGPASGLKLDFGAGLWNGGPIGIPVVSVPGTQTRYPATFLYQDESDSGPYAVPLNAPIEGGAQSTGDRHALAVDRDNCVLYELYRAFPQTSSWTGDSGSIYNLRSNALRPAGWTSADAAGLPILPGLVRYDEVITGEIRHALRFTVPQTQKAYVWPARHYASSRTDTSYPPMGLRFRLKASFDVTPYPAEVQVILRALKTYGMMLADNGSAWYVSGMPDDRWNNTNLNSVRNIIGTNFEAVDVSSLMIDANSGQARQPQGSTVTISPPSATVTTGQSQPFTATVGGTAGTAFSWSVNGVAGGNATVGYISTGGVYTAPQAVPAPGSVDVAATSSVDSSAVGHALVTVRAPASPVSVSISPTSASVRVRRTVQFRATVTNTTNTAIRWAVNGKVGGSATTGTISASGLYTAPSTAPAGSQVTVSAISVADPSRSASAVVTIWRYGA